MEKMKTTKFLARDIIPAVLLKGVSFVRVDESTYVTLVPIAENVKSQKDVSKHLEEFEKKIGLTTTLTTEDEWNKLILYCQINFCLKEFIKMNCLDKKSVINKTEIGVVKRGGPKHSVMEKCSLDWANPEPKSVFATIKVPI